MPDNQPDTAAAASAVLPIQAASQRLMESLKAEGTAAASGAAAVTEESLLGAEATATAEGIGDGKVADPLKPTEGEKATDDEAVATEVAKPAEIDPKLIVEWPGRREGEAPTQIVYESEEHANRARHFINQAAKATQAEQRATAARAEAEASEEAMIALYHDPVGALFDTYRIDDLATIALNLVLTPEVRKLVGPKLAALTTEDQIASALQLAEAERVTMRDRNLRQVEIRRATNKFIHDLDGYFETTLGHRPPEQRQELEDILVGAIERHQKQTQRRILTLEEAKPILARTASALQISLEPPAADSAAAALGSGATNGAAASALPAKKGPAPARSVEALKQGDKARQAVGAAAPSGHQAPVSVSHPLAPPKGSGIKAASAHLRGVQQAARSRPA